MAHADNQSAINIGPEVAISIKEIIEAPESFVIVSRSEYGATTLARRLVTEFIAAGAKSIYRDASLLPNYQKKLREEFSAGGSIVDDQTTLVLDNFDFENNERLLKEIIGLNIFKRLIILARLNLYGIGHSLPLDQFRLEFKIASLSGLGPADIRILASQFFETSDVDVISATVEKTYSDLLDLCIPVTPSNVIMYLSILHREGDFRPLHRVQIVNRYISELLRKPSDSLKESFTAKNAMDVISDFVFGLFKEGKSLFSEADWFLFCRDHMKATLSYFDERSLFSELIASRIMVRIGPLIAFKYRFFYLFFVGRYVGARPKVLAAFIADSSHLKHEGLVEIISEISSDNTELVSDIVTKLNEALSEFNARYVPDTFDPFSEIEWHTNEKEDKNLWEPLSKLVAAGPRDPAEIDQIKRSLIGESSARNQTVVFQTFDKIERRLVVNHIALIEALKNSDNLDGELKKMQC